MNHEHKGRLVCKMRISKEMQKQVPLFQTDEWEKRRRRLRKR